LGELSSFDRLTHELGVTTIYLESNTSLLWTSIIPVLTSIRVNEMAVKLTTLLEYVVVVMTGGSVVGPVPISRTSLLHSPRCDDARDCFDCSLFVNVFRYYRIDDLRGRRLLFDHPNIRVMNSYTGCVIYNICIL